MSWARPASTVQCICGTDRAWTRGGGAFSTAGRRGFNFLLGNAFIAAEGGWGEGGQVQETYSKTDYFLSYPIKGRHYKFEAMTLSLAKKRFFKNPLFSIKNNVFPRTKGEVEQWKFLSQQRKIQILLIELLGLTFRNPTPPPACPCVIHWLWFSVSWSVLLLPITIKILSTERAMGRGQTSPMPWPWGKVPKHRIMWHDITSFFVTKQASLKGDLDSILYLTESLRFSPAVNLKLDMPAPLCSCACRWSAARSAAGASLPTLTASSSATRTSRGSSCRGAASATPQRRTRGAEEEGYVNEFLTSQKKSWVPTSNIVGRPARSGQYYAITGQFLKKWNKRRV